MDPTLLLKPATSGLARLSTDSDLLALYADGPPSPIREDGSTGRSSARSASPIGSDGHIKRRSFSQRYSPDDYPENLLTGQGGSQGGSLPPWSATAGHRHTESGSSSADLGSSNIWHVKSPSTASSIEPNLRPAAAHVHRYSASETRTLSDGASVSSIPLSETDATGLTKDLDLEHYAYPPKEKKRKQSYRRTQATSILQVAANEIRRLSARVVNLRSLNIEADQHIRLPDEDDQSVHPGREEVPVRLGALRGKSLFLFGPTHPVRRVGRSILLWHWTEPLVLLLIITNVVILTIQAAPSVFQYPRITAVGYFHRWEDWALFSLMLIFTFELFVRMVVSGLLLDEQGLVRQTKGVSHHARSSTAASESYFHDDKHRPLAPGVPFRYAIERQQAATTSTTPFLRHSYNRIDLVAVACFWLSFVLAMAGAENSQWLYIFRGLSVLRAARLLTLTTGTSIILQSLKKAGPLLVNVALFVFFAIVLFSIIGVQSFKGSFSRSCVWIDPAGQTNFSTGQLCGGFYSTPTEIEGFVHGDGRLGDAKAKGYICPLGQKGANPYNGTESFDNIGLSALQVIIVASANSWSPVMYGMMDADYFASCLFFIVCLVVLNFWLINMFVAVITSTFASITDETRHSAFGTAAPAAVQEPERLDEKLKPARASDIYKRVYGKTKYLWVALIVADVAVQGTKTNTMSPASLDKLSKIEGIFTGLFAIEILLRFFCFFPDWRAFLTDRFNQTDLCLVIITSAIQLPFIRQSGVYPWLTCFQLARFYRVMLALPRIRRLLVRLSGSIAGFLNMTLFLLMMTFIAALMAAQFLRGEIPEEIEGETPEMTFYQMYNGFLATYQVLTSENWTTVLFSATGSSKNLFNAILSAIFFAAWFAFANFVLIRMFIAVINEAFSAGQSEKEKHALQKERYMQRKHGQHVIGATGSWLGRYNPYLWIKDKPGRDIQMKILEPLNLGTPFRGFALLDKKANEPGSPISPSGVSHRIKRLLGHAARERGIEESPHKAAAAEEDLYVIDRHLDLLADRPEYDQEAWEEIRQQRATQAAFIARHPSYDRPLWIVPQSWKARRWAQYCVRPGYGQRVFGKGPIPEYVALFDGIVLASVIGSIVVAGVATPVYRQDYFIGRGDLRLTWFNMTEVSLGFIFLIEFGIKVLADGFLFCPNAYLLSIWNDFDFFILLTLLVNVVTALISGGAVSRLTRVLKALRALRLITLLPRIRSTFYHVLILGASKLLDASVLAVLYIIPYAAWGQNIFSGLLFFCNDSLVANKLQCVGEYVATPAEWPFLAPRVWANPYVWSFDSFRNSFLILFEIISLEGWTSVLQTAMAISGRDQQPVPDASQINGLFFVVYILVGGITILALFISVIIENFTRSSGHALLTTEQRQWIDLKKLLKRQRPSKRPRSRPTEGFKAWCFRRAVEKHGWWSRGMTGLYLLHIVLLMTEAEMESEAYEQVRDYAFLFLTALYLVDVVVRAIGLGWTAFRRTLWNLYDIAVVGGTAATTIAVLANTNGAVVQLQKLFLVSIAFKLVQKNDSLNTLFKTSVGSLPAILDLLLLWFALFIVWAIAYLEIFSLTKWQASENHNANFTSLGKSLVMLAFMSVGEGWNAYMHDYTVTTPLCTDSPSFLFTDCGSPAWAFIMFLSWNVISMYIFANMFTGVVVENFAYVAQLYGRVKSLNREEMRAFKRIWAEVDVDRTGFLKRKQFPLFFSRLRGAFEVRIYPEDSSVGALLRYSSVSSLPSSTLLPPEYPGLQAGVDLALLEKKLRGIDHEAISRRRKLYNRLFHEAMLSADRQKGLSFNEMLFLLAHYKLRQDDGALQVEELLQRQEKMHRVDDLVSLERVRGVLATMYYRKQFLHYRKFQHAETTVPAIMIQESDTPRLSQRPLSPDGGVSPPLSPVRSIQTLSPTSPKDFYFVNPSDPTDKQDPRNSAWAKVVKKSDGEDSD